VCCKAGSLAQRIRSQIQCQIEDFYTQEVLAKTYVYLRGEIQVPKAILQPLTLDLGAVYIHRPVECSITLQNLSNLPTKFKLDRPGGISSLFNLQFVPDSGVLQAKECLPIQILLEASVSGVIDQVLRCKVYGVRDPLPFQITAVAKGLQIEFRTLEDGQAAPAPLGKVTDLQYMGDSPLPTLFEMPCIDFGEVQLFERKILRVAIRNVTAVATRLSIHVGHFRVPDGVNDDCTQDAAKKFADKCGSNSSFSAVNVLREMKQPFTCAQGREYIAAKSRRSQNRKLLALGLGAAYGLSHSSVDLLPWGVHVLTISENNDMPGRCGSHSESWAVVH
jgi:hypothetical protein